MFNYFSPFENLDIKKCEDNLDSLRLSCPRDKYKYPLPITYKNPDPFELYDLFKGTGDEGEKSRKYMFAVREQLAKNPKILPIAMGTDGQGGIYVLDMFKFPHLLVAGTTGWGKSVMLTNIIISLLLNTHSEHLKLYIVDFKRGLSFFEFGELLNIISKKEVATAYFLQLIKEMENRYDLMLQNGIKDWKSYMLHCYAHKKPVRPFIVCIIDEFADYVATDDMSPIVLLAAQARGAGIYLVIATQYPKADVVSTNIKSQLDVRACFKMSGDTQERNILDRKVGCTTIDKEGQYYLLYRGNYHFLRTHNFLNRTTEGIAENLLKLRGEKL